MSVQNLTCIECPVGCTMEICLENGKIVYIKGNGCPRGKMYAENEVVCPRRVLTSTVRSKDGKIVPVKTAKPIKKSEIFTVMEKVNKLTCALPVKIGDVICENITEDISLIATGNIQ